VSVNRDCESIFLTTHSTVKRPIQTHRQHSCPASHIIAVIRWGWNCHVEGFSYKYCLLKGIVSSP